MSAPLLHMKVFSFIFLALITVSSGSRSVHFSGGRTIMLHSFEFFLFIFILLNTFASLFIHLNCTAPPLGRNTFKLRTTVSANSISTHTCTSSRHSHNHYYFRATPTTPCTENIKMHPSFSTVRTMVANRYRHRVYISFKFIHIFSVHCSALSPFTPMSIYYSIRRRNLSAASTFDECLSVFHLAHFCPISFRLSN